MDFVQTMKDWKRMCNATGQEDEYTACDKCDLRNFECPAIYEKECNYADWNHVESVVTKWAAEHPEPQFPSWGEWFAEQGELCKNWKDIRVISRAPIIIDADAVAVNSIAGQSANGVIELLYSPIPADIAEKLGIEPKEVNNAEHATH